VSVYAFGSFLLDEQRRELTRGGRRVDLQPKAFDLLVHLLANRDRVVGKEELLASVWPGVAVSDSSLSFGIKLVRKALGDTDQTWVRTSHGRGFRFVRDCSRRGSARPMTALVHQAPPVAAIESETPLVGRRAELDALVRMLEEAAEGSARVVILSGDAGIGKTRLARELAAHAAAHEARFVLGTCDESSPPAFWPWLPVLRRLVETLPQHVIEQISQEHARQIARLLPAISARTSVSSSAVAQPCSMDESLLRLIALACGQGPLVLCFDDIQWADGASLRALEHVIEHGAALALLVVVLLREGESEEAARLRSFLQTIEREHGAGRMRLEGLSEAESRRLLARLPGAPKDPALVGAIARMTEGNPFFAEEIVRHLCEQGAAAGADSVAGRGAEVIGVREIVERRLARLTPSCGHVLTVAAVAGREFVFDVVCGASGITPDQCVAAIDEGLAARILEQDIEDPARFRFRHALIRDAIYGRATPVRRGELHRSIGENIEQIMADGVEGRAEELAHHFFQAGALPDKALAYARTAAERALARQAHEDAARRFEQVAIILARSFPGLRIELHDAWLAAGDAHQSAGDGQHSRAAYHHAAEVARSLGDAHRLLLAATADRSRRPFSGFEQLELHEEAAAIAMSAPDVAPGLAARALSRLAATLYNVPGTMERREDLARRALALTAGAADVESRLVVLDNVSLALWRPAHVAWRIELAQEQERLATAAGAPASRLAAMVWRISARLESGQVRAAMADIDSFVPAARRSRLAAFVADVTMFDAMRALLDCRFERAEALVAEALERGHESDEVAPHVRFGALMMALRAEQGRSGEILPMLHVLEAQMPDLPWAYSFADLYAQSGDHERAGTYFDAIAAGQFAGLRAMEGHSLWLPSMFLVARACRALARGTEAAWLHARLLAHEHLWAVIGQGTVCLGSMQHALGLLAAAAGNSGAAAVHLETAISRHDAEGALLPALRSRLELARLLAASGSTARARTLLEETGRQAAAAGHRHLQEEIAQIA